MVSGVCKWCGDYVAGDPVIPDARFNDLIFSPGRLRVHNLRTRKKLVKSSPRTGQVEPHTESSPATGLIEVEEGPSPLSAALAASAGLADLPFPT